MFVTLNANSAIANREFYSFGLLACVIRDSCANKKLVWEDSSLSLKAGTSSIDKKKKLSETLHRGSSQDYVAFDKRRIEARLLWNSPLVGWSKNHLRMLYEESCKSISRNFSGSFDD